MSMKRRTFIAGLTSTGLISIAGCTSTSETPPPRRSDVIENIEIENNELVIEQYEDSEQWVASRRELSEVNANTVSTGISSLSPIGVAEAKGRGGRGATSRGSGGRSFSSAPKTRSGRGFYGGGPYVGTWYNDHDDEVERYPVDVKNLGVAYIGTNEEFSELNPGPGEINNWNESLTDPDEEIAVSVNELESGWYRVGADVALDASGSGVDEVDFGWEAVDVRVEETSAGKEITERWKVSPRI
jgi:hypothetical protein